jgi:hypothetical protein
VPKKEFSPTVFRNKLNEHGQVIRNKTILACKVYSQVEGIDFEENFPQLQE